MGGDFSAPPLSLRDKAFPPPPFFDPRLRNRFFFFIFFPSFPPGQGRQKTLGRDEGDPFLPLRLLFFFSFLSSVRETATPSPPPPFRGHRPKSHQLPSRQGLIPLTPFFFPPVAG